MNNTLPVMPCGQVDVHNRHVWTNSRDEERVCEGLTEPQEGNGGK